MVLLNPARTAMTSSCGGKGPFTAEQWAARKARHGSNHTGASTAVASFAAIARILAKARQEAMP